MSSTKSGSSEKRKKILRTRVRVWGRFNLRAEEVFNVDKAEQIIRKAVDGKTNVQTVMKLFNDGLRVGEKGVLAALPVEFIRYTSITAFISLRETPTLLALCSKAEPNSCVTVVQFKDLSALEVVCDIIDKQRGAMTRGRDAAATPSLPPGSLNRSEVSAPKPQPLPQAQPKPVSPPPTLIVTAAKEEEKPEEALQVVTARTTQVNATVEPTVAESRETTITTTTTSSATRVEDVSVVVVSSSSGGGSASLFEKRPFVTEITQPPVSAEVTAVVHQPPLPPPPPMQSSASATVVSVIDEDFDDDNHFRTSIVFGEEIRTSAVSPVVVASTKTTTETTERQQRMEAVLQSRSNGHAVEDKRASNGPIDAVILNYDDIDTEGTHAVFDTPDGPPTQLNESADNVRFRRPQSLQVTASSSSSRVISSSSNAPKSGGSRYVVTSFSSGRSDSPTDGGQAALYVRTSPTGNGEAYRTSTVIYRDSVDSPGERPRVSYVTTGQPQTRGPPSPQLHVLHHQQQQQQPIQLVRLVPVGSARRRIVQQQQQPPQQYYAIQPVSARENGLHLVAK